MRPSWTALSPDTRSRTFKWPHGLAGACKKGPQNRAPRRPILGPPQEPVLRGSGGFSPDSQGFTSLGPPRRAPKRGLKMGVWRAYFRAPQGQAIWAKSRCRPSGALMFPRDWGPEMGPQNGVPGRRFWATPGECMLKNPFILRGNSASNPRNRVPGMSRNGSSPGPQYGGWMQSLV